MPLNPLPPFSLVCTVQFTVFTVIYTNLHLPLIFLDCIISLPYFLSKAEAGSKYPRWRKNYSCRLRISVQRLLQYFPTKPIFLNVYGTQESIPRNEFRQPKQPGGPVRKPYSSSVPSPHRLFKNSSSGYIRWRNSFLVIDSGAPYTLKIPAQSTLWARLHSLGRPLGRTYLNSYDRMQFDVFNPWRPLVVNILLHA